MKPPPERAAEKLRQEHCLRDYTETTSTKVAAIIQSEYAPTIQAAREAMERAVAAWGIARDIEHKLAGLPIPHNATEPPWVLQLRRALLDEIQQ